MNRNRRRFFTNNKDTNKMLYISGGALILSIVFFIIVFIIYLNVLNNDDELSRINAGKITSLASFNQNMEAEQTSFFIGKSVNEIKEDTNNINTNEDNKKDINNNEKQIVDISNEKEKETVSNNIIENEEIQPVKNEEQIIKETEVKKQEEKEPEFIKPVDGEIIKDFAKDNLIYSKTLEEWVIHTGVDIKAEKTTIVKSAEEGIIKSIKNDPRYGITVVIEHNKGYKTVYSNLYTAEFVKEGEKVLKGQTIGTVGDTAIFEIADESHIHFEILKDEEYVDPNLYLK